MTQTLQYMYEVMWLYSYVVILKVSIEYYVPLTISQFNDPNYVLLTISQFNDPNYVLLTISQFNDPNYVLLTLTDHNRLHRFIMSRK